MAPRKRTTRSRAKNVLTAGVHGANRHQTYGRITLTRSGIKPGTRYAVIESGRGRFTLTPMHRRRAV